MENKQGEVSFWWDNQTGCGAIANMIPDGIVPNKATASQFIKDDSWD